MPIAACHGIRQGALSLHQSLTVVPLIQLARSHNAPCGGIGGVILKHLGQPTSRRRPSPATTQLVSLRTLSLQETFEFILGFILGEPRARPCEGRPGRPGYPQGGAKEQGECAVLPLGSGHSHYWRCRRREVQEGQGATA